MHLSEFEVRAVTRVAAVIFRKPILSWDEPALARLVGMTPYHLTRCFQHYHGMSLRQYAKDGDWNHEAMGNWVLLAI
jgi:AraC-like DNA-binding protein